MGPANSRNHNIKLTLFNNLSAFQMHTKSYITRTLI